MGMVMHSDGRRVTVRGKVGQVPHFLIVDRDTSCYLVEWE